MYENPTPDDPRTDFVTAYQQREDRDQRRRSATGAIVIGLLLILIGAAITVITLDAAVHAGGGSYVIALGPMVAGGILLYRGLGRL